MATGTHAGKERVLHAATMASRFRIARCNLEKLFAVPFLSDKATLPDWALQKTGSYSATLPTKRLTVSHTSLQAGVA